MTAAAAAVFALPDVPIIRNALAGLQVAVVGILAAAMWRLARSEASSLPLSLVLLAAFAVGLFANAALVIAVAGLIGIVTHRVKRRA